MDITKTITSKLYKLNNTITKRVNFALNPLKITLQILKFDFENSKKKKKKTLKVLSKEALLHSKSLFFAYPSQIYPSSLMFLPLSSLSVALMFIDFKYEKDSVMVVTEEEYKHCLSSKPLFFDNNGDTVVRLDRAGLFYFISGVSGHCEKGQRMIIKVLEPLSPPQPPTAPPQKKNSAVSVSSPMLGMLFLFFVSFPFI